MKFNLRNIILVIVLKILLIGMLIQLYIMWGISSAKLFVMNAANINLVDQKGVEAAIFWKENQFWFYSSTIGNLIAISLLGLLVVLG